MSSSKEIPRSNSSKPISGVSLSVDDTPMPPRNECTDRIKNDIASLEQNKCLKCSVTKEKTPIEWQRYISSICSNYSRKLEGSVKFTVRIINQTTIGIWRTK